MAAVNIAELSVRITTEGVDPATKALAKVGEAGKDAAKGMGEAKDLAQSLYFAFNGLAGKAFGVNQSLSDLFARIGQATMGTAWTAGILVGLTAIGEAWKFLAGEMHGAAEESQKAAETMKKSIDDLVNAGGFADLERRYRDALNGTRAGNYADGITGLRAERARLFNEGEPQRLSRLGSAKTGRVITSANPNQAKIDEIDAKIAERQDEIDALHSALTDPRNSLRAADRFTTPITTRGKSPYAKGPQMSEAQKNRLLALRFGTGPDQAQFAAPALTAAQLREGILGAQPDPLLAEARNRGQAEQEVLLKASLEASIKDAAKVIAGLEAWDKLRKTFAEHMSEAVGHGLAQGIATGISSGSIGQGFQALGDGMVGGLGAAMVQFGEASLKSAIVLDGILQSFMDLLPGGAIAKSLEIIAIGAALQGAAGRMFGGRHGGAGGSASYGSSGYGGGALPQIIDRGIIALGSGAAGRAPNVGGLTSMRPIVVNLIGKDDRKAQREMFDLLNAGRANGLRFG